MLKTIKEQVRKVITYSQEIPEPQVDDLIDQWLEAKRDFIEAFGGKLIYELALPVTFELTQDARAERINNLIDYVEDKYDNPALRSFINRNRDTFFDNKVNMNTIHNGKSIPRGMKLLKAFKYFVPGERALDDIQTRASQIIQENKVTGTLCFSVHPLDFLSSSENNYNWRSCHALDGEYRAGNLSYMLDKSTIICYLKGAEKVKLPLFPEDVPWNNKKWRVLLHFSENWDIIFAGRQYPFESEEGIETVRTLLLSKISKDVFSYCKWTDPVIYEVPDSYDHEYDLLHPYVAIRGQLHELTDVVTDCDNPLHFNDVLRSSYYRPHYTAINNRPWFKQPVSRVYVGSPCKCLRCNQELITNPETFMCDDCELEYGTMDTDVYTTCDCCGRRIMREEAVYVDDEEICESCVQNECFICDECDELHFNEFKTYIEDEDKYVCKNCKEEYYSY